MTTQADSMSNQTAIADQPPAAASGHTIPTTAVIVTEKCYLRPYEDSDAEPMVETMDEMAKDPEVIQYLRVQLPSPYTLADSQSWIKFCHSSTMLMFGVFTLEGEWAGSVSLRPHNEHKIYAGTHELGYLMVRKFWGRGIMTDAVRAFTPWAFATYPDLLRIEAVVFDSNAASLRVLEKCGFIKEGRRRLAVVKDGRQMDEFVLGLVRTDLTS
ncbi:hypothetical protein NUW58_g6731 [Xylaria curta]|uniref:Uncharacterized protein n=1 Tax=Xylaria curta TaxID=42375 RepID=A0ACC1NS06_9PEZI|nr:hypothetical protein NUW58_g6731 [Xylaria curta]